MVKFLHAADIHLDSPLTGLSAYEGAPVALLRTATRSAFMSLVDAAIEEQVDFLVIAGDLYDGDWKDYNTGLFFSREMGRLHQADIPVFIVYGNHDAESAITKQLKPPANVRVFSARHAQTHRLSKLKVALHGQSFKHAATRDNLANGYPEAVAGWLNIGVLHTALEGHSAHATYAPCSISDLEAKGYDYWALGHVHEFAVRSKSPWVVYPGNLQGRHVREVGPHGAVMVTVEDGELSVERIFCDVLRWHRLEVDVGAAASLDDVQQSVSHALEELLDGASGDIPMAARLTLVGRTRAYGALYGLETQLRAEVLARANALGDDRLWIEKLRNETTPAFDERALAARSDAIADLQIMLAKAETDEAFLESLLRELKPLLTRAPKALVERVSELDAIRTDNVTDLVKRISPALIARIESDS